MEHTEPLPEPDGNPIGALVIALPLSLCLWGIVLLILYPILVH